MPWYGWLGWILMLVVFCATLLYFALRKKQPANLAEAKLKLRKMEDDLKKSNEEIVASAGALKKAQQKSAAMELKYLEDKHEKQIADLKKEEIEEYEEAKKDPKSGVDYMRNLLGLGTGDGSSGPE